MSNLSDAWHLVELRDFLKLERRKISIVEDQLYRQIGIRSHGLGIFHKEPVSGAELGEKRVFWVEPGDFTLNIVFAWEDAVALVSDAERGMCASHRFPTFRVNNQICDSGYLLRYFKSESGIEQLKAVSPGGAGRNKTLNQSAFLRLKIPLPPLLEQRKIAAILSTWDEAITLMERLIEALRQRKQALMQMLLTGEVRFPGFEGEEWEEMALREVAFSMESGGTPSTQVREYWKGDVPWITGADFDDQKVAQVRRYITDDAVKNSSTKIVRQGDILLVTRTGVGKMAVAAFDVAISQDITGIVPNRDLIQADYLISYLAWTIPQLARFNQGTSINGVTRDDLKEHRILVPGLNEQRRIADIVQVCDLQIEFLKKTYINLQTEKRGLMQQLLTGAIRVQVDE